MTNVSKTPAKEQQAGFLYRKLRSARPCLHEGKHAWQCDFVGPCGVITLVVPAASMTSYSAFKKAVAKAGGVVFFDRICEQHRECWQNLVEHAVGGAQ